MSHEWKVLYSSSYSMNGNFGAIFTEANAGKRKMNTKEEIFISISAKNSHLAHYEPLQINLGKFGFRCRYRNFPIPITARFPI